MRKTYRFLSLFLATIIAVTMLPFTAIQAIAALPTITLSQSVFKDPESSAALTVKVSQTSPDQSTASLNVKASATATGSSTVEGWSYQSLGIRVDEYKFAKITYYYDTNSDSANPGTGNAAGQHMKFLVGYVSNSTGTILQQSGSNKWFGNSYSSRDTIVANQEATCVIDFSGFYTANEALLSANPTYNVFQQVKWTFLGLSNVSTLNIYDKMYVKKVEFYTYDPENDVTVTFDAGEGTGTSFTDSFLQNTTITFPAKPSDFTYAGKCFVGWNYNGTVYPAGATATFTDSSPITISAAWESVTANTVYVKSTGNDTNEGLCENLPFATISKAISTLSASGGKIIVCDSVNFAGTMPANSKLITISGEGYSNAELFLANNAGSIYTGPIKIENIKINNGAATHYDPKKYDFIIGEGVSGTLPIMHIGAYSTGAAVTAPTIPSAYFEMSSGTISTLCLGGAYIQSEKEGIAGDAEVVINGGTINNFAFGFDSYLPTHTGGVINGNILITISGGTIETVSNRTATPVTAGGTYQIIFNNGYTPDFELVYPAGIEDSEKYIIHSGIGGMVKHAKDANGNSVDGTFDIIPDEGKTAQIYYSDTVMFCTAGRYTLPSNTDIFVSYTDSETVNTNISFSLNGGDAYEGLVSVAVDGSVSFPNAPTKEGYLFKGWYNNSTLTDAFIDGTKVTGPKTLYAAYIPVVKDDSNMNAASIFTVEGIQIRIASPEHTQGLRFITRIDRSTLINSIAGFNPNNSSLESSVAEPKIAGFGSVVLPKDALETRPLVLGGVYSHNGKNYTAADVPANKLLSKNTDYIQYSAVLTEIPQEKYTYNYAVRPYIKYYTASGSLNTFYSDFYSTNVFDSGIAICEAGREDPTVLDYIRNNVIDIYGVDFSGPEVNGAVNDAADNLMNTTLFSANMSLTGVTGKVYYVSSAGNDSNNGTSTSTPWKTLTKVNTASLVSGDVVLFKRGDTFRGQILCKDGVKYSAYGTPAAQGQVMNKPKIIGSARNYADSSLWLTTAYPNVYKYNGTLSNVGIIAFNHSGIIPKYDEIVGRRKTNGLNGFVDESDLDTDLDFYSNLTTNEFFVYSTGGNPGTRFTSIEIGERAHLVVAGSGTIGITLDNFSFMYGGAHGISSGSRKNVTATNNVFAWIGGSILTGFAGGNTTGYGNAIEVYGSVDGYYVKNNFIYQIYDTGITHQCSGSTTGNIAMNNIQYYDNLIMYCHWSIEYYNAPNGTYVRTVKNVDIQRNILRFGGYGWGSISQNRQTGATLFNSFGMSENAADVENFVAKDNIFDRSLGSIVRLPNTAGDKKVQLIGNTYIQSRNKGLGMVYSSGTYPFEIETASSIIKNTIGDTAASVYFYMP